MFYTHALFICVLKLLYLIYHFFTCIIGVFTLKVIRSNMSDRILLMFDDKNKQQDDVTKKSDV